MTTTATWVTSLNATNLTQNSSLFMSGAKTAIPRDLVSLLLTITIGIVMIGMGCGVDVEKVKEHLKRPTGIIVGVVSQFLFMPAIAYTMAKIAQMDDLLTLALLLVGSCPGGTTSNIVTYWLDGDVDLSITMTAVSCTLGLGMMPLLLWIYSFGFPNNLKVPFDVIDFLETTEQVQAMASADTCRLDLLMMSTEGVSFFGNLGITVASLLVPITIGIAIRMKFPKIAPKLLKILSVIGILAIIVISVLSIVAYNSTFQLIPKQIICAAIFPGVGMCLGYGLSSLISLYKPLYLYHYQRRTISIETGIQNAQLATAIIQLSGFSLVDTGRIILFPVIYVVCQLFWTVMMLTVYRVYVYHNPHSAKEESFETNDDDTEKGIPPLDDNGGAVNNAFTFAELPKYEHNVGVESTKSTHL